MAKKKILLTTVFRPYAAQHSKYNKEGDEEWLDYLSSRLTKEPGPFTMSDYLSGTSLPLIAANLDAEVTVLVHPSLEEFTDAVKKGGYDFVGISFLIKGLGKLLPMIAVVRKHAPQCKVVIGGFGTMLHNVQEIGADFVSKGEGVSFFRNLIGQNLKDPVQQPLVTGDVTLKLFRDYKFLPRARYAELTHGFGCPHKCDFCSTSAYFGYLHIPFATGRALYDAMADVHQRTGIDYFYVYEEDMCLYKKSIEVWGDLIREDPRLFSWAGFSTVKSLTSWDLEELVSMGFSHVWIGVESVTSPFDKSQGRDMKSLFDELHSLGVTTTGSMIFGLDHHHPDNLHLEVDHLADLYPSTAQLGTLMPAEGTEVRRRLEAEGRVRPANYYDSDLHSEIIIHPNFEPGQIRAAVFSAYDDFYQRVGPAIHRINRTLMQGARRLANSPSEVLRRRGAKLAQRARFSRPIFLETLDDLPTPEIREQVAETLGWMRDAFGPPTAIEEAQGRLVKHIFDLERSRREIFESEPREPELKVRRWVSGQEQPARLGFGMAA